MQPTDIVFQVSKLERLEYAFCTVNRTWRNGVLSSAHLHLTLQNKLAVILMSFCAKRERERNDEACSIMIKLLVLCPEFCFVLFSVLSPFSVRIITTHCQKCLLPAVTRLRSRIGGFKKYIWMFFFSLSTIFAYLSIHHFIFVISANHQNLA